MPSVTQRIKKVKQPRGGYINPCNLQIEELTIERELNGEENINPSLVGMAVDYLTRYPLGSVVEEAFNITIKGAMNVNDLPYAKQLLSSIEGLTDDSILFACQLFGYDVAYRAGLHAYRPGSNIQPDKATIENIRLMVERSLDFFQENGPVIMDGFDSEGAYTDQIHIGDGDFITERTL